MCASDTECTATTKCTNLFNFSQYDSNPSNNSNNNNNNNNCTGNCTVVSVGVDSGVAIALAATPAMFLSYYQNTSTCWDADKDPYLLARNGLRYMEGLPEDTSTTVSLFMCAPDPEVLKKQNATQWAMDQAVVTGTTIIMKDLYAWTVTPAPVGAPPATGSGTASTNGVIQMVVSIMSILVVLLM